MKKICLFLLFLCLIFPNMPMYMNDQSFSELQSMTYSPDGKFILTVATDADKTLIMRTVDWNARIWDAQTGKLLHTLEHTNKISAYPKISFGSNRTYYYIKLALDQ